MRLLLTGGTGFFGKALLRHWSAQATQGMAPADVTLLSRAPGKFLERFPEFRQQAWLRFHAGDILLADTLPAAETFTHILHAAADSTFGPRLAPLERYDQIVDGTRNVLDHAVKRGIPRVLFISSGGVYGPQPPDVARIPESWNGMPDPLIPEHAYSVAKRCAEHLCALYRDGHALHSDRILVNGDGSPIRSYMDQRDLAAWLIALLENGQAGQAYNVGSDREISIRELAYLVRDVLSPGKPVVIAGQPGAANFRNRYVPSVDKAIRELGLGFGYTLRESLSEAARPAASGASR
jgi:UDP-glucuronate decarboxylase